MTAAETGTTRRWPVAVTLGVVLAIVALLAVALSTSSANGGHVAEPAPSFEVQQLGTGAPITDASLRGRVVVLNFWASWCAECTQEVPALRDVWNRVGPRGVRFVGITYQDDPNASAAFIASHEVSWTVANDPGATTALAFGVVGVPETVVIGPSGSIVAHAVGPITADDLLGWVRLAGKDAA